VSPENSALQAGGESPTTHWDLLAAGYDPVMGQDPAMRRLWELILAELPERPGSILDLGTGTGALLALVRARSPECLLTGLDPAPAMLEKARQKFASDPAISFIQGSAARITAPDQSFDTVVSNFALHHLEHDQKRQCAEEIFRVLRPGGLLIFGDQHCRKMGSPDDVSWMEDMLDLFTRKAHHYLTTAGKNRMLLQIELLPRILTADGEVLCTVGFWLECLTRAGFLPPRVVVAEPAFLLHRVIVARKPDV